jgi:hypothetical protein
MDNSKRVLVAINNNKLCTHRCWVEEEGEAPKNHPRDLLRLYGIIRKKERREMPKAK